MDGPMVHRLLVQFPAGGPEVAFFATGPGWVLKCSIFLTLEFLLHLKIGLHSSMFFNSRLQNKVKIDLYWLYTRHFMQAICRLKCRIRSSVKCGRIPGTEAKRDFVVIFRLEKDFLKKKRCRNKRSWTRKPTKRRLQVETNPKLAINVVSRWRLRHKLLTGVLHLVLICAALKTCVASFCFHVKNLRCFGNAKIGVAWVRYTHWFVSQRQCNHQSVTQIAMYNHGFTLTFIYWQRV